VIYKVSYDCGQIYFCAAKNVLHLLQSLDNQFDLCLQEIESINEISPDVASSIIIEVDDDIEFLDAIAIVSEFQILASNDWY
jgi:hypothetical protein